MPTVRRWTEAAGFVAVWMALGFALRLGPNAYLLLGIPLCLAFQRWRGKPVRVAWVADAPPVRFDRTMVGVAIALGLYPGYVCVTALHRREWLLAAMMAAASIGAFAASYALRHLDRAKLRRAVVPFIVATTLGLAILAGSTLSNGHSVHFDAAAALRWLALYFPLCFVIEEVALRGVIDSHVHPAGATRGWPSAMFVSVLWGLWHLPIAGNQASLLARALALVVVHTLIGVPLSFAWRRSDNLAVTCLSHALIDAVRNALG